MSNPNLMTKAEYARHRGISQTAIAKHLRNGTIITTDAGFIEVEVSDVILDTYTKGHLDQPKGRPYTEDEATRKFNVEILNDSYLKARADLTRYKADQAKLELELAEGNSVSKDSVYNDGFTVARYTRDAVLSVPDRVAAIVAAETDILEVKHILKEELTKALDRVIKILKKEVT